MRIRIVARSSTVTADRSFSWEVDIYANGDMVSSRTTFKDPLNKKERARCRWYLNEYRQNEPYSTSKAKSAASLLADYGSRLKAHLRLASHLKVGQPVAFEIEDLCPKQFGSPSLQQLYWEFLEDEGLWQGSTSVSVHRVVSNAHTIPREATTHVSMDNRVRLLLVTARDLRREWTSGSDIRSSIVSDILWQTQSDLKARGSSVELDVEIVRPGTFEAFKRHLKSGGAAHGHRYDIVHFDMHGTVGPTDDESVAGYLHFNDPDSLETEAVSAREVSKILDGQNIAVVVLNACDSANATYGDEGNIAETFARFAGVQNVLAMTHMASESAIDKSLNSFYSELIVHGHDFTEAAKLARTVLRVEPLRDARFHLHIPMIDWTVPVVYSPGGGSFTLCQSACPLDSPEPLEKESNTKLDTLVLGRDFDILRLEKLILPNSFTYLFGTPGIGKSTLLHKIASSWIQSGFVSQVFYLDFSAGKIASTKDFVEELLRKGRCQNHKPYAQLEADSLDELRTFLSSRRAAFILDGLMDHDVAQSKPVSHIAPKLFRTLREICPPSTDKTWQTEKFFIISGRAKSALDTLSPDKKSYQVYELEGLQNADAISLVEHLSPAQKTTTPDQAEIDLSDAWKAEPIISLLQGNPAGLIHFSRLAQDSNMALPEMYRILHSEDIVHFLEVKQLYESFPLLSEFIDISFTLSDSSYAVWAMLAWYWHVGPVEDVFSEMLREMNIVTDKTLVIAAIREAQDLGYIEKEYDGTVTRIGPLFTIFMRIVTRSSACRINNSASDVWLNFRRSFAFATMKHLTPSAAYTWPVRSNAVSGPEYAIRLMAMVLSPSWTRDLDDQYWKFLIRYLMAIDKRCDQMFRVAISRGVISGELQRAGHIMKENLLFVLKLCRGRGALPVHSICWPREMIVDIGNLVIPLLNTDQVATVADCYEQLLQGSIANSKLSGGMNAVQTEDLPMVLQLASTLGEIHRTHIATGDARMMEFVDIGIKAVEDTEKKYGVSSDPEIIMSKSMLSFCASILFIEERKPKESREKLEEALSGFREASPYSNPIVASRLEKFIGKKSDSEAASHQGLLDAISKNEQKIRDTWELCLAEVMGHDMREVKAPRRSGITAASHPVIGVWDIMLRNHRQICSPANRLDQYETQIDRGHWMRALSHHGAMMLRSLKTLDFDEVHEHLDAQERIGSQNGLEETKLERIRAGRDGMKILQSSMKAGSPTEEHFKGLDTVADNVEKYGFDATSLRKIREIVFESMTKDKDMTLPHNHAPGVLVGSTSDESRFSGMMKKHGSRIAESREYGEELLNAMATSLETLRELERAEDRSDEVAIYKYLDELLLLTENKWYADNIKASALPARRRWNTGRLMRDIATELQHLGRDKGVETFAAQALPLLNRCRTIVALDGDKDMFQGILENIEAVYDGLHLTSWVQRALAALETEDDKHKFVGIAQDMLDLNKQGVFERALTKDQNKTDLNTVWVEFFYQSISIATEEHRWAKACELFADWRSHNEIWTLGLEDSRGEAMGQLEAGAEGMACMSDFWNALQCLDVAAADAHMNRLRLLGDQNRQFGNGALSRFCALALGQTMRQLVVGDADTARQLVGSMLVKMQAMGLSFQI